MKGLAVITLVAVCVCVFADEPKGYGGRLANINVDTVLKNSRVQTSFLNCFLEKGPCTPEGREAKKALPEIYYSNCAKCSKEQKVLVKKTIRAFRNSKRAELDMVLKKYDPTQKHEKEFLEWVNGP